MWMMAPLGEHYDDGFGAIGDAFWDAAQRLRKSNGDEVFFLNHLPEIYLLRHSIELFLRSGMIGMHRKLKLPYDSEPYSSPRTMAMKPYGKWEFLDRIHDIHTLYNYWKQLIVRQ